MKQAILLASALAFAATAAPALAKPGKGHGNHGNHAAMGHVAYQGGNCPPGLAKKNNGCLPPGQAKKLLRGQRYLPSYGYQSYAYDRIPYDLRRQYGLDPYDQYYYNNGSLYGVDPQTMIIQQVLSAILR